MNITVCWLQGLISHMQHFVVPDPLFAECILQFLCQLHSREGYLLPAQNTEGSTALVYEQPLTLTEEVYL